MARTVQGTTHIWQLGDAPIGSGDAGEVYAVTCPDQPDLAGVLKKPARIASSGTIQRQASQIAQEGLALAQLNGLPRGKAHPPHLLDQAPDFTAGTANYFIVSEMAPGVDLASLLAETRQAGTPFPRRVIITVLDALFDLFARAHRLGVLWNDVKLDHIYWDALTGGVTVIDWGNAQFLDTQDAAPRNSLPRWEDYRQMVDTLGGFLEHNAPELHADLGWGEFQRQDLDSPRVSILARRIAYQQQVVALRVMEYQSLIRVVLSSDPSLAGLERISAYQKVLEQIGAPWHAKDVLSYGKALVQTALTKAATQTASQATALQATALIWDLFGEALNLPWHLVREYFRHPNLLTENALPALTQATFSEDWTGALWRLVSIARSQREAPWWDRLIPVLRQKALGLTAPSPYQTCQRVLAWMQTQEYDWQGDISSLENLLANWRSRGEDGEESPFEYAALALIQDQDHLPRKFRTDLKQSVAIGNRAIRDLFQAWVSLSWEALPKAFQNVLAWDPHRWGLISIKKDLDLFKAWLDSLAVGPPAGEEAAAFLARLMKNRPPVERFMGTPPWMHALLKMLQALLNNSPIADHAAGVRTWCPWLLTRTRLQDPAPIRLPIDEAAIHKALRRFTQRLKNWSDLDAGLDKIKVEAPHLHPYCQHLADGFHAVTSLNANLSAIENNCTEPPHLALSESWAALKQMLAWRQALNAGNLEVALKSLDGAPGDTWRILLHAREVTAQWHTTLLPFLRAFPDFSSFEGGVNRPADLPEEWDTLAAVMTILNGYWQQILTTGIHDRILETLEEAAETARSAFFAWRRRLEHGNDRVEAVLYHRHLTDIRAISDRLLQLTQHSRQARLTYATLDGEAARPLLTRVQAGDRLLAELGAIETILKPDEAERRFPAWQAGFHPIREAATQEEVRARALTLARDHPLYAWLVQSVLAN